jgi:serine/threonine protein phosphatase PrpC
MAAWSEAAGRPDNEDSFQLSDNLSAQNWAFTTDEVVSLDEKGALLVVCDGMGGMNAGEVASAIAVETIKEWFSPERLLESVTETPETISDYIEKAILAADSRMKAEGQKDSDKEGMGSTIVLAWLIGKHVYVGWCGDSRAYRYNPASGLERISHDHSYVQELVDAGKLMPEQAFNHPHSNIITRSLGDLRQEARPDTNYFPLCNNDVLLLCSDGLSGVLRDSEIEAIIANNTHSMENCRNALWNESQKKGWQDNVTIALCQVLSGGGTAKAVKKAKEQTGNPSGKKNTKKIIVFVLIVVLLLLGAYQWGYFSAKEKFLEKQTPEQQIQKTDTTVNLSVIVAPDQVRGDTPFMTLSLRA